MKSFLSLRLKLGTGMSTAGGQQVTAYKSSLLGFFINKVLLEYSPACSLAIWLLIHHNGSTEEEGQRLYENIVLSGPFQ